MFFFDRPNNESEREGVGSLGLVANETKKLDSSELEVVEKKEVDKGIELDNEDLSILSEEEIMERRIKSLRPAVRPVVYNLAYFANSNPVVRTLIEMGVELRQWDRNPAIGSSILKLDFERDVKPRLLFLHDLSIAADKHVSIIQNNPGIFQQSVDDLKVRIEYLKSKKFSDQDIKDIVTSAPRWFELLFIFKFVDRGFLVFI